MARLIGLGLLLLAVCSTLIDPAVRASDQFAGYWLGTLSARARELRLLVHVTATTPPTATLTSIDQDGKPRDLRVTIEGRSIALETPQPGARIQGTLREDGKTIDATFEQGGASFPLTFSRVDGPPRLNRPQHPSPPFPYTIEEVVVDGPVKLAGTFSRPAGDEPFPAVVLISGSGPQDRDQTIFGHKPFLVLADHLTRHGIAVLRFDDRGAGASSGSRAAATMEDYAADALAAVRFLERRPEVDRRRIGLIGHSEGGVVAPLVARGNRAVSFIVLIAAPALNGAAIATLQGERIARAAGANDDQIAMQQRLNTRIFEILAREVDEAKARAAIRIVLKEELARAGIESADVVAAAEKQMEPQVRRGLTPWFRHFLSHDPVPSLRAVRVPVLALYGSLDVQVPAAENAPVMAAAIGPSSPQSAVRTLPGLNHLFQTAKTGAMEEYGRIEETLASAALETISNWILVVAGSKDPADN